MARTKVRAIFSFAFHFVANSPSWRRLGSAAKPLKIMERGFVPKAATPVRSRPPKIILALDRLCPTLPVTMSRKKG